MADCRRIHRFDLLTKVAVNLYGRTTSVPTKMFTDTMPDEELLNQLKAKYERSRPGDCPTCGAHVVVEPHAGGYPLPWVCPVGKKALDEAKAVGAAPDVIQELEHHVFKSRWEDYRRIGDRRVMELISRYESLKNASTNTSPTQGG